MKKILMILLLIGFLMLSGCSRNDWPYCTKIFAPVCGVDNVTYGNNCMAGSVKIAHEGLCSPQDNGTVNLCDVSDCGPAPNMATMMCSDKKTISGPTGRCLKGNDNSCRWEIIHCPSTQIANPASKFCIDNGGKLDIRTADDGSQTGYCTINGKECEEWALMRGECPQNYTVAEVLNETCALDKDCTTPGNYLIRSSCPYTSKCIDNKCTVVCPVFDGKKYINVTSSKHICTATEKAAQICTMDYRPVCGPDNVTYGNGCGACAAGIDYWIEGECV